MPIYEYECSQCGMVEEAFQKVSDEPLVQCRYCSGKLTKLISQSSFHLKGSGWYVTDYAKRSSGPKKTAKSEDATGASNGKANTETSKTSVKDA